INCGATSCRSQSGAAMACPGSVAQPCASVAPVLTSCSSDGVTWKPCSSVSCGVSLCLDQSGHLISCPPTLTLSSTSANPHTLPRCTAGRGWVPCGTLTCVVPACLTQDGWTMPCPPQLSQPCPGGGPAAYCFGISGSQPVDSFSCGADYCVDSRYVGTA